jgi:hypothetical protein
MDIGRATTNFEELLTAFEAFWRRSLNRHPGGGGTILCDLFHHDPRVSIRALFIAKAIEHVRGGRTVALGNAGPLWDAVVLPNHNRENARRIAAAFGAGYVDMHRLSETEDGTLTGEQLDLLDRFRSGAVGDVRQVRLVDGFPIGRHILSTYIRLARDPHVNEKTPTLEAFSRIASHCFFFYNHYTRLLAAGDVSFCITSHVDYSIWGILTELCIRRKVPVLHFHTTQDFKIFCYWPELVDPDQPPRVSFTQYSGRFFREELAPLADAFADGAERVVHHNKLDQTRPSWWLTGSVFLYDEEDRRILRETGLSLLGWSGDKPVYCLFLHSLTDALWNNAEVFDGYVRWVERTLDYAVTRTDVNWLVRSHPQEELYDATGSFRSWEGRYAAPNVRFSPARTLDKNVLWSLCDLGITVRGSISNELPCYGVPVVLAGESEMSRCGFGRVAHDEEEYWDLLRRGPWPLDQAEVRAARFWMFYYRVLSSVKSIFIPGWNIGSYDHFFYYARMCLATQNIDEDPFFDHLATMISRRDPVLMRYDLVEAAASRRDRAPAWVVPDPIRTAYDEPRSVVCETGEVGFAGLHGVLYHEGFSEPHPWGRWTIGETAAVVIRRDRPFTGGVEVHLQCAAAVQPRDPALQPGGAAEGRPPELEVAVFANGRPVATLPFDGDHGGGTSRDYCILVPAQLVRGRRDLSLVFHIPVGRSQPGADAGKDQRRLGLAVARLRIDDRDPAAALGPGEWRPVAAFLPEVRTFGFDLPRDWGRWTVGPRARLLIPLPADAAGAYRFEILMRAQVFPDREPRRLAATVLANGHAIAVVDFAAESGGATPKTYAFGIDAPVIGRRPVLQIDFVIEGLHPEGAATSRTGSEFGLAVSRYRLVPLPGGGEEGSGLSV